MKLTIVYDNEVKKPGLTPDWGFACVIEIPGEPQLLFDTGADGSILLNNMKELGFDPQSLGTAVISHSHWDHTGGLTDIQKINKGIKVYTPQAVKQPLQICKNVWSTGELQGIEQSLAVNTSKGILVVVGCSHPGVGNILDAASKFGKLYGLVGGFHGFSDLDRLTPLSLICPCHCTQYKSEIKNRFKDRSIDCGAGVVIEV